MTALVDVGPGPVSVDEQLLPELRGPRWAGLSLASAVVGSYLATAPPLNKSDADSEQTPAGHGDPATNGSGDIETTAQPATAAGEPAR